ncbi:TGACG-sequence-specific DNA-binding protein TGA-1A [Orobanche hederae]
MGSVREYFTWDLGASNRTDQEASKPDDKVLRRLAQNREVARKYHLRKKAIVEGDIKQAVCI